MTEAPTAPAYMCRHAEFHPGPALGVRTARRTHDATRPIGAWGH
jgi:hypothetical protein